MESAKEIRLQDVALRLHISHKTLKRWLEAAQIEPIENPRDRREKLLKNDQFEQLKNLLGDLGGSTVSSSLEEQVMALRQEIEVLKASQAAQSNWIAAQSENMTMLLNQLLELKQGQQSQTDQRQMAMPASATR